MASYPADEKRNLPGWSLARDAPREKPKQGWQCPAPTVQDWEDYQKWKEQQGKKDELPAAPQIYLADMNLLFYQDAEVQFPWIHRLRCELPRRVGRLSGELPVKASYVGFGLGDEAQAEGYQTFKRAMAQINVVLCRHIHNPPNRFELAHLEQSDVVLVDDGDRKRLWETLGTDVGSSQVAEHIKWRYLQGGVVIAVGAAMSLLGEKSWYEMSGSGNSVVPFTGWKIFPHIVAPERPDVDHEELVEQLGGAGVVILGVHPGGAIIFNKDGLVEPVRHMCQEYRWDWQSSSVKQALLLGPPRSTGLICPLYAANKEKGLLEDDDGADVYSYALTQEEEQEEEHLIENFNVHNLWLPPADLAEVERLKASGNEAFKAKKADMASISYEQARVHLKSCARRWGELDEESQKVLNSLAASGDKPAKDKQANAKMDDYKATHLLFLLALNQCAAFLLAHEQDVARAKQRANGTACAIKGDDVADQSPDETKVPMETGDGAAATTLVEVRDNLIAAFRAANEALVLTEGQSAKAWYRRGCVFEKMRDPRNALRDFEESLKRSPGDKVIAKKRDQVAEAANQVAENMYYARHKELDAQQARLKLETRHALFLRGVCNDVYKDKDEQFALFQPLARVVEGTLQEIDGKPTLEISETSQCAEDSPYLHPHALWTWEFMVQRATGLQLLRIEDVDLGSGPLEWICKGLRTHSEIRVLEFSGVHLGPAGAKMLRNVVEQNNSLIELSLDSCGILDAGLDEIATGLSGNSGRLEILNLRRNHLTHKKLFRLVSAFCQEGSELAINELDLSGNPLGVPGAKELAKIIGSGVHGLRVLRLQDCLMDLAAFWRLVGNLDDARALSKLDLRRNPIGRGTRRCWRSTMGPTLRCEVALSDHPLKTHKEALREEQESDVQGYPMPRRWV